MKAEEITNKFVNRSSVFALQTKTGIYVPVKREITLKDIEQHLAGEKTVGIYQVNEANRVKWGVIDTDKSEQAAQAAKLA
ncbi:MAG: hypothetical protein AABY22_36145, partial [Nanoarchaeota archaeon]